MTVDGDHNSVRFNKILPNRINYLNVVIFVLQFICTLKIGVFHMIMVKDVMFERNQELIKNSTN